MPGRAVVLAVIFFSVISSSWGAEVPWKVTSQPSQVAQGSIGEIRIAAAGLVEAKGWAAQREISFSRGPGETWGALFGIDLQQPPGPFDVIVQGRHKDGIKRERVVTVEVKKSAFPTEQISVPPSFDQIDDALRKRIERESDRFEALWRAAPGGRLWREPFISPLPLEITSPFGLRRVVNGSARSPHGGLDLKAVLGAPVKAANDGVVVLRDEFFFAGKALVLDHGGGLYTMYFHLADFRVEDGAAVRKGEVVGLAGMTGRVTGPHLHWGVRLNGARVNPLALPGIDGERG